MPKRNITDDEFFQFLDELRESGVTNMHGSPAFLMRDFDIDHKTACEVFLRWSDYKRKQAAE